MTIRYYSNGVHIKFRVQTFTFLQIQGRGGAPLPDEFLSTLKGKHISQDKNVYTSMMLDYCFCI